MFVYPTSSAPLRDGSSPMSQITDRSRIFNCPITFDRLALQDETCRDMSSVVTIVDSEWTPVAMLCDSPHDSLIVAASD